MSDYFTNMKILHNLLRSRKLTNSMYFNLIELFVLYTERAFIRRFTSREITRRAFNRATTVFEGKLFQQGDSETGSPD